MRTCFRVVPPVLLLALTVLFTAVAGSAGSSDRIFFVPIDLGTLGGTDSQVAAVNDSGQIVGLSLTPQYTRRAFSWTQAGGMIDLGTLGGSESVALAVNRSGQVVGWSLIAGDTRVHAFLWTQEAGMIDLGTLGGSFSVAYAVNASGQVVGASATASEAAHAFSWTRAGGMIDLHRNPADRRFISAHADNTSREVIDSNHPPTDSRLEQEYH